jgi:phage terminase Nu1 subunit (DNA packaging protein)
VNLDDVITQKDFADLVGLSEARVSQLAADGVLVRGDTFRAWLLAYCERLRDQAAGRLGSTPDGLDLVQERAMLARHQGGIAQMKLAELRGELIRVEAVRAVWASRIVSTRDALLQIPSRLAPVLAAETNLATVTQLLDDELRQALEQLSTPTTATTEGNPHVATH